MPDDTRSCLGCGDQLPPRGPRERNPRKWCSAKCRVWTFHHPGVRRPLLFCRACDRPLSPCNKSGYCQAHYWRGARPPKARPCEWCGRSFRREKGQTCSLSCGQRLRHRDSTPEVKRARARARERRKRDLKRGARSEVYTLAEIAARDRYRCGLCRKRVAMTKIVPHPKAPTIDHLVPLSKGGDDTRANAQLAHLGCNSRKHNRGGGEQLRLIG